MKLVSICLLALTCATSPFVEDITDRLRRLDPALLESALIRLTPEETQQVKEKTAFVILESRLPLSNGTFIRKKEPWNSSLVKNLVKFTPPSDKGVSLVYQLRYRLNDQANGKIALGLSNEKLAGAAFALTGCFLMPDGHLISSSLGAARFAFTSEIQPGDIVDWLVEVHPDITMDIWLMVNGMPKGRGFALDFDEDIALLESLQPAIAFTGDSHGDTALLAAFPPIQMEPRRLYRQIYRSQLPAASDPEQPYLGQWEIAMAEGTTLFQHAPDGNVQVIIGLLAGSKKNELVMSCNVANSASTVLTVDIEVLDDRWIFAVKSRAAVISTMMMAPPSLQKFEKACNELLETVDIIGYHHEDMLGIYYPQGKLALTRAVPKVSPFADNAFIFAMSR